MPTILIAGAVIAATAGLLIWWSARRELHPDEPGIKRRAVWEDDEP